MRPRPRFLLASLFLFYLSPAALDAQSDQKLALEEALNWVRKTPSHTVQYNYEMSARVRLLILWVGKENVGGGYVRRSRSSDVHNVESIQVLFGSDPAKAPRAINRWGAGTEVFRPAAPGDDSTAYSAFFGFMKSSRSKSASEMQGELAKEDAQGQHLFSAILSRVDSGRALSLMVPMQSNVDYNLHQLSEAESYVFDEFLSSPRPVKKTPSAEQCPRNAGFLGTVAELIDDALAGQKTPVSLCYVYDAQVYTLTLRSVSSLNRVTLRAHAPNAPKDAPAVERTYSDLLEGEFLSESKQSGKRSGFTLVLGTAGNLRGIPVQIRHQPNWWFQVVLNLCPESSQVQAASSN